MKKKREKAKDGSKDKNKEQKKQEDKEEKQAEEEKDEKVSIHCFFTLQRLGDSDGAKIKAATEKQQGATTEGDVPRIYSLHRYGITFGLISKLSN